MRPLQIHVASAIVGVLLAAGIVLSMSLSTAPVGPPRIEYGPHPRDVVQVTGGTTYVVPVGMRFVLTGLGLARLSAPTASVYLRVNGVASGPVQLAANFGQDAGPTMISAPPMLAVPEGCAIDVDIGVVGAPSDARAWGYLSRVGSLAPGSAANVRVAFDPNPRDAVLLTGHVSYAVPPGKLLVVTALGGAHSMNIVALDVDGQPKVEWYSPGMSRDLSVGSVPFGLVAPAGSIVDLRSDSPAETLYARAWGYLANAQ